MSKTFVETLIKKKSDDNVNDNTDSEDEEVFIFNPDVETSQIRRHAMDLFSPLEIRLQYLELFYNRDPTQFSELISCINGMYSLQKDHCKKNRLPWNDARAQASAKEAFDRLFTNL